MNAEVFVGLDVSRTVLQIAVRPSGEHWSAGVDDLGMNETAEKIRDIHPNLVVMEAHGGVELPVAGLSPPSVCRLRWYRLEALRILPGPSEACARTGIRLDCWRILLNSFGLKCEKFRRKAYRF